VTPEAEEQFLSEGFGRKRYPVPRPMTKPRMGGKESWVGSVFFRHSIDRHAGLSVSRQNDLLTTEDLATLTVGGKYGCVPHSICLIFALPASGSASRSALACELARAHIAITSPASQARPWL
jgi:hypothetical protein